MALQSSLFILRRVSGQPLLLLAYTIPNGALCCCMHIVRLQHTCSYVASMDKQSRHYRPHDVLRLPGRIDDARHGNAKYS